jgi:hypothetical protein
MTPRRIVFDTLTVSGRYLELRRKNEDFVRRTDTILALSRYPSYMVNISKSDGRRDVTHATTTIDHTNTKLHGVCTRLLANTHVSEERCSLVDPSPKERSCLARRSMHTSS